MIPMMGGLLGASVVCGRLVSRTGRYKRYPTAGAAVMGAGLALISTLHIDSPPIWLMCGYTAILGIGIGMGMQILILIVQNTFFQARSWARRPPRRTTSGRWAPAWAPPWSVRCSPRAWSPCWPKGCPIPPAAPTPTRLPPRCGQRTARYHTTAHPRGLQRRIAADLLVHGAVGGHRRHSTRLHQRDPPAGHHHRARRHRPIAGTGSRVQPARNAASVSRHRYIRPPRAVGRHAVGAMRQNKDRAVAVRYDRKDVTEWVRERAGTVLPVASPYRPAGLNGGACRQGHLEDEGLT